MTETSPLLHDDTIILRALEPEDLDTLFSCENDTGIWDVGTTIAPFSRRQLADYIATYDNDIFRARQLRLMIDMRAGSATVGILDIFDFDPANARAGIGILIFPGFARHGYASRAINLAAAYCSRILGIHQLYAHIPADNRPSLALFRKCGFSTSGRLRSWLRRGQSFTDVIIVQNLFP